jgi:flagellar capping protein FliD
MFEIIEEKEVIKKNDETTETDIKDPIEKKIEELEKKIKDLETRLEEIEWRFE